MAAALYKRSANEIINDFIPVNGTRWRFPPGIGVLRQMVEFT
jgi:hypothetical protein